MAEAGSGRPEAPFRIDLNPEPPEGWDDFVRSASGSSFCHLGGWGRVLKESLRIEPLFFSARVDSELRGVLPLYRMPTLGLGHTLVSVPYLNYGGPLGGGEAKAALSSRALEEAREKGDRGLELRTRESMEMDSELAEGRRKITVTLPLPDDPEVLFKKGLKAKVRSQVRRPMKEGMEARFGPDQLPAFYGVFARNMRDLGTPVLPYSLFDGIARAFPHEADFGVVYQGERPVAGGCGFHFRGEFEMTWASSLREFNRQAPNMLLYWSFMERCIARGDQVFNFGRCTPGGGTHRFKSQWGGEDETLNWLQWPEEVPSEDPDKGVFKLATRVWQKLPLPVANGLGPVLARRIPTF